MDHTSAHHIRAFLYARSATEKDNAPTENVDRQLQRLREYAQSRSYIIVGEAVDAAQSGNKVSRPGLEMIMSESVRKPPAFNLLLVTNPARLARSFVLLRATTSRLTDADIAVEFAEGTNWPSGLKSE